MRPSHACVICRDRRRKCELASGDVGCVLCLQRGFQCSLAKYSPRNEAVATRWEGIPTSPSEDGIVLRHRNSITDIPPPAICEELVNLYLLHVNDKFHSLFHPPTLLDSAIQASISKAVLLAVMSISARFSDNSYFQGVNPRLRGAGWANEAARLLDLRDVSLTTIQVCVLLGCYAITESEASAEAVYYSVACRMAMLLDLARAPTTSRLDREVRIRVWWTLCMIDVWASAGVRLPRAIPQIDDPPPPMPMVETTFLQLHPGSQIELSLGYKSNYSLLAQMIKLNSILVEINTINEQATSSFFQDFHDYDRIEEVTLKLDNWLNSIPDELQDTDQNLAFYASQGLGSMFVAVYLGFYNFGQMLFYQFLHSACHDDRPHVRTYANKCKSHATALCKMIYRSYEKPGCEVTYTMVGHILVIASSIQLHTLLFDTDETQIRAARQMLERNFEILTHLQKFWPSLDICFSRFREFHKICQRSQESSFKMDRWMLKFLLEFAKPVGEKGLEEPGFDPRPLTMHSLGISPSSSFSITI